MSDKEVKTKYSNVKLPRILVGCFCLMLFILLIAYLCISQYYKEHFYAKTFINGMDCSNLTVEEAKDVITTNVNSYVLTVTARDGSTQQIAGQQIELACTFDKDLSNVLADQSPYSWLSNAMKNNEVDNPYKLSFNEDKLNELIDNLDCMAKDKQVAPTDAAISSYDKTNGFTIVKEEQGNKLIKKRVRKSITDAVNSLTATVSLEEAGCYKTPSVTSDSQIINTAMETVNKYMQTKLTYKFGDQTEVLDASTIGPAITVDKKYNVNINKAKIKEYITYLDEKYTTKGGTWKFTTSYGSDIKVKGGTYGWGIDTESELTEVMSLIKEGAKKEKTPVSAQEGTSYGQSVIGDSYVEVSLSNQKMFCYQNGKKVLESSIVTGKTSAGHGTPSGVYYIYGKQTNRILRGFNDDGTRYSSHVNYWMPFNGGIGLHDASWRGSFGGTIYRYSGSHGCVNLPSSVARQLYSYVSVGTPVIVY